MGIFDKLFGKKKEKEERFNIHKLKEKRDIDGLMEVLREDPKRGVASKISPLTRAAISAIGEIGDERAIEPLNQALNDVIIRLPIEKALKKIEARKS